MIYVKINKVSHCFIIGNEWILSSCHRLTKHVNAQHTPVAAYAVFSTSASGMVCK